MAALVLIGIATTCSLRSRKNPPRPKPPMPARQTLCSGCVDAAVGAFSEFLSRDMAFVALAFVVLFKFTDALSGR